MSLYTILGVAEDATSTDIKKAFKSKAQRYHPDKPGGGEEAFKGIQKAYDLLSDPDKRARYDETGETNAPKINTGEKMLAKLFNQMIDEGAKEGNLIETAKQAIANKLREIDRSIVEINIKRNEFASRLDRIETSEGVNLYENVLNQRIQDCDHALEIIAENRKAVQEAQILLEHYEDTAPQIITNVTISSTPTGSIIWGPG